MIRVLLMYVEIKLMLVVIQGYFSILVFTCDST